MYIKPFVLGVRPLKGQTHLNKIKFIKPCTNENFTNLFCSRLTVVTRKANQKVFFENHIPLEK